MSDPEAAVRARLTVLQARLAQSTPEPLEGQQTIPVDDTPDPDSPERPPDGPTQPPLPLWT